MIFSERDRQIGVVAIATKRPPLRIEKPMGESANAPCKTLRLLYKQALPIRSLSAIHLFRNK
jgi:hypothetical protein